MKKVKVVMLGLCLLMGLTACGKEAEVTSTSESNAVSNTTDNSQVVQDNSAEAVQGTTQTTEETSYEPMQEIIDATWDSGKIQFKDKIIQMPVSLTELIDMGFDYEVNGHEKDYLFANGESVIVNILLDGETLFQMGGSSTLEGFHTCEEINPIYSEAWIWSTTFYEDEYSIGLDEIYFPGGIKIGGSYKIIEEKLGAPHNIDSETMAYEYGQYMAGLGLKIGINRDTQTIYSINYTKKRNIGDINNLSTITLKDVHYNKTTLDVSLQYFDEYYKDSYSLENMFYDGDNLYYMEFWVDLIESRYYTEPWGEVIYEQIEEDGTVIRIYNSYGQYEYAVTRNGSVIKGIFKVTNISAMEDTDATEQYMEKVKEIVNSIEF